MNQATIMTMNMSTASEFVLTDAEFNRIRELVRAHTGITLTEAKRQMVYGRLARRLRALKMSEFAEYVALLERADPIELQEFTNAITTNLTSFFREPHHFEYLAEQVLPEIAARTRANGRLRIWSCACSSGEEPYSIAMVVREQQRVLRGMDMKILATDLDSSVLATGAAGVYPVERLRGVSNSRAAEFFNAGTGAQPGTVKVAGSLRQLITFKQLNLMDAWPMRGQFDVIFCRNVMIYFDKPTQEGVVNRLAANLEPGGYLFIGHAESLTGVRHDLTYVRPAIYRKPGSASGRGVRWPT